MFVDSWPGPPSLPLAICWMIHNLHYLRSISVESSYWKSGLGGWQIDSMVPWECRTKGPELGFCGRVGLGWFGFGGGLFCGLIFVGRLRFRMLYFAVAGGE